MPDIELHSSIINLFPDCGKEANLANENFYVIHNGHLLAVLNLLFSLNFLSIKKLPENEI